jgi:hypothetical protein
MNTVGGFVKNPSGTFLQSHQLIGSQKVHSRLFAQRKAKSVISAFLPGTTVNRKRSCWDFCSTERKSVVFPSSRIDDIFYSHRSGCPFRARLLIDDFIPSHQFCRPLIWAPHQGRVEDFLQNHQLCRSLIRAPHQGRVDDFLQSHQLCQTPRRQQKFTSVPLLSGKGASLEGDNGVYWYRGKSTIRN